METSWMVKCRENLRNSGGRRSCDVVGSLQALNSSSCSCALYCFLTFGFMALKKIKVEIVTSVSYHARK